MSSFIATSSTQAVSPVHEGQPLSLASLKETHPKVFHALWVVIETIKSKYHAIQAKRHRTEGTSITKKWSDSLRLAALSCVDTDFLAYRTKAMVKLGAIVEKGLYKDQSVEIKVDCVEHVVLHGQKDIPKRRVPKGKAPKVPKEKTPKEKAPKEKTSRKKNEISQVPQAVQPVEEVQPMLLDETTVMAVQPVFQEEIPEDITTPLTVDFEDQMWEVRHIPQLVAVIGNPERPIDEVPEIDVPIMGDDSRIDTLIVRQDGGLRLQSNDPYADPNGGSYDGLLACRRLPNYIDAHGFCPICQCELVADHRGMGGVHTILNEVTGLRCAMGGQTLDLEDAWKDMYGHSEVLQTSGTVKVFYTRVQ